MNQRILSGYRYGRDSLGLFLIKGPTSSVSSIPGQFPSTKSQGTAFKSIGSGLLGKKSAEDLQILAHFWAEVPEPVDIPIAAGAEGAVSGIGK